MSLLLSDLYFNHHRYSHNRRETVIKAVLHDLKTNRIKQEISKELNNDSGIISLRRERILLLKRLCYARK